MPGRSDRFGNASNSELEVEQAQILLYDPGVEYDCFGALPVSQKGALNLFAINCIRSDRHMDLKFFKDILGPKAPVVEDSFALALQHKHTFYAGACFFATQQLIVRGDSLLPSAQERHLNSLGIHYLQQAIDSPDLRVDESTLRSIFYLSFSSVLSKPLPISSTYPRQSVLRSWLMLDQISAMGSVEPHYQGLHTAIQLRGGIHSTSLQVQSALRFQDLMRASRMLMHPVWPFVSLLPQLVLDEHLIAAYSDDVQSAFVNTAGRGGAILNFEAPSGPWKDLLGFQQPRSAWTFLADLTNILQRFMSGLECSKILIVDQMALVQYCLMSLPTKQELSHRVTDDFKLRLYEMTRLAAIVYAHLVTWPTAPRNFPRQRLIQDLRAEITPLLAQELLDLNDARHVAWATVLGAILALGIDDCRAEMVKLVRQAMKTAKISTWADAKVMMESYLWHSHTSDFDALQLWIEVQKADESWR